MVTIALLLQACVTITRPETGKPLPVNDGFGIVVGRIRMLDQREEQYPWDTDWVMGRSSSLIQARPPPLKRPLLAVLAVDSNERNIAPAPDADGWFCWELPAGRYLLYVSDNMYGGEGSEAGLATPASMRVLAAFMVSDAALPHYIGELLVEIKADWLIGDEFASYSVTGLFVQSAPVDAQRWLSRRYPGSSLDINTQRFVVAASLDDVLVDYSKARTIRILESLGIRDPRAGLP
ncbi:MAG: hypothetical protein OEW64_05515 [Gammaproteobacteria bacterium]|nr:hypothetical protein [Gammaproteobacteria bacterium]MDH5303538.1 hypothetical protein [Gammaproteobacteria bacterium]MDH5321880.1 hypothetical protein [Gammaproteobacteria bacterium]